MKTETPTRPVLRYHGGKWRLAPWIIAHFPPHKIYVEPYGGAGSVLLRKPRAWQEVYNDLDGEIVNLFRVLRSLLELTPLARLEFQEGYTPPGASGRKTGFRGCVRSRGTVPAMDWATYPKQLPAYVERLRGVVIECMPALDLIRKQDTPECLFYVDPPYPAPTRTPGSVGSYRHELTEAEHRELADTLKHVSGMVVLSGYPCTLYDAELYPGWKRVERQTRADGAKSRTEVLWLNAAASKHHSTLFQQKNHE